MARKPITRCAGLYGPIAREGHDGSAMAGGTNLKCGLPGFSERYPRALVDSLHTLKPSLAQRACTSGL